MVPSCCCCLGADVINVAKTEKPGLSCDHSGQHTQKRCVCLGQAQCCHQYKTDNMQREGGRSWFYSCVNIRSAVILALIQLQWAAREQVKISLGCIVGDPHPNKMPSLRKPSTPHSHNPRSPNFVGLFVSMTSDGDLLVLSAFLSFFFFQNHGI